MLARRILSFKAVRPTLFVRSRRFSDDSHSDFAKVQKKEPEGMENVLKLIEQQIKENPVILYMKGTPSKPQCGFSLQTVRILNAIGVDFAAVNVLDNPGIREGIKQYSDWPTIPQLYVNQEFIGGCDIVTNMFKEGDLQKLLEDAKLISKE